MQSQKRRRTIWAVVLAAGESRRMGKPKMLLPFGGKTIIETILDTIAQSGIDGTIVVLGADREAIEKRIESYDIRSVLNAEYRAGMLSSVQAGVRALPDDAEAFILFLGDQPMVPYKIIDDLIEAYRITGKEIVLPVYRGKSGHPVLIVSDYREEIYDLSGGIGLRELMCRHTVNTLRVPVEVSAVCRDIDDPADYERELEARSGTP